MPDDDQIQQALQSHSHRIDQQVADFLASLGIVIELSQHRLSNYLLTTLALDAGLVARTAANIRILRRLPQLWQRSLAEAGLERVVTEFTDTFPQQIREFEQILRVVNHVAKEPLPIPVFTNADRSYFKAWRQSAAVDIASTVEAPGAALRTAPGISFKDLSKFIVDKTGAAKPRAEAIAETALMVQYRTVSATGYERIQSKLGHALLYSYMGPLDRVTRPFCRTVLEVGRDLTRQQIDGMDSGQGKGTVFYVCGGFRCRHSWNVSLKQSA